VDARQIGRGAMACCSQAIRSGIEQEERLMSIELGNELFLNFKSANFKSMRI
jgi:hypothetical protein